MNEESITIDDLKNMLYQAEQIIEHNKTATISVKDVAIILKELIEIKEKYLENQIE